MITCYLRYTIDPFKISEFEEYARRWIPLVERFGGQHHGYYLPHESASDVAVALFSFSSLAAYEKYRSDSMRDPDCQAAYEFANRTRCFLRFERQFLRPVDRESKNAFSDSNECVNEFDQPIGFPMDDWSPPNRPPHTSMQGRFCRVVPLQPEIHANQLYEAFQTDPDGRNWTYLPYGPFNSFADFTTWLTATCVGEDPLFYSIENADTEQPIGMASYLRIQPNLGSVEVGHVHFSPLLQRTAAATEAMYLMMARAFDELGYRRYEWKCDALNSPSRRAAERLGFSFEGVFRQAATYKGRSRDTAWFSITDKDWPDLKRAYADWLSSHNHDNHRQQRRRLADLIAREKSRP